MQTSGFLQPLSSNPPGQDISFGWHIVGQVDDSGHSFPLSSFSLGKHFAESLHPRMSILAGHKVSSTSHMMGQPCESESSGQNSPLMLRAFAWHRSGPVQPVLGSVCPLHLISVSGLQDTGHFPGHKSPVVVYPLGTQTSSSLHPKNMKDPGQKNSVSKQNNGHCWDGQRLPVASIIFGTHIAGTEHPVIGLPGTPQCKKLSSHLGRGQNPSHKLPCISKPRGTQTSWPRQPLPGDTPGHCFSSSAQTTTVVNGYEFPSSSLQGPI